MKSSKKRVAYALGIIVITLVLSGCAVQSVQQKHGMNLYHAGEYDKAVKELEKALKNKPTAQLRTLLFRTQLASYYTHLSRARQAREVEKKDDAVKEYKLALGIFPNNKTLMDEMDAYLNPQEQKPKTFVSTIKPPVTLEVDPKEKMSLNLKNTPITKIFNVVGKAYGINFIFDKDFRDFVYNIEIASIGFYEVLKQLCMVSSLEYRVLDKSSVLLYPNTTFKKRTFGLMGVKVFYLSNTKADDVKKLLMTVFREEQILVQEDANLNNLIIKAEYNTLVEIERFLNSVDKRKSEVILEVEVLELTKSAISALGVNVGGDVSSALSTVTAGLVDSDGKIGSTMKFSDIKDTSFFLTIPSAALNFLESQDKSRIIAKPNLRGVDGEEIKFMVGDEVPVPQTQFQSVVPGSTSQYSPVTSYQYRNVGAEDKITPFIHSDNEVTLKVKLTINNISGYQNDFPVFGKRELENVIRLKEGETNIIGGFIKDELRTGVKGIPFLSRFPLLGRLFSSKGNKLTETDLVFSITPRILQKVEITSVDREAIWADVQEAPVGSQEIPAGIPSTEEIRAAANSVIIAPAQRRLPVNSVSYFTLRVNTTARLSSLAVGGTVSGGNAVIEEGKTDFFGGQKVQVFSNVSGTSFDFGYSFPEEVRNINVVAQLKIKFNDKGTYTINLRGLNAVSLDRQPVELTGNSAQIEVY